MVNPNTAEFYDRYWGGDESQSYLADKQLDEIAAYIVRRFGEPPKRVMDLGGGVSRIARLAKRAGHKPLVVDFSQAALDVMRAEGIETVCYDIARWSDGEPLLCNGVDITTCTETLEHLEQPAAAVRMAAAHSKRAFFTVPNDCLGPEECETHLRKYTLSLLRTLLYGNGWRVVEQRTMHRWLIVECLR